MSKLPLSDIIVFEMAGLAPAPFAGLILADYGAKVIRVDKSSGFNTDVLTRNKRSLALDLKNPLAIDTLLELFKTADVILDPFRPGVMEKLGLGPDVLFKINPRIIYARLSGYGQTGGSSQVAGHDINYLSLTGALNMIGRQGEKPMFPLNILADFAGGGLMCVMGILMALMERTTSGKGQVVDASLTAGTSYLTTFPYLMQKYGLVWDGERGENMLDSGAHFYEVYQTKDNLYMAVGAIEPQFYAALLNKLKLNPKDMPDQHDKSSWQEMKAKFAKIFATKTQNEWTLLFDGSDACVTPVLSFEHPIPGSTQPVSGSFWPRQASPPMPAPILSRTPAKLPASLDEDQPPFLQVGQDSVAILEEFGIQETRIKELFKSKALVNSSKL